MRYGIITIHDTLNYGSTLQTFGLYYGMKKLGLDVEVINYRCEKIYQNEFIPFKDKSLLKRIPLNILYGRKYKQKRKRFKEFFDKYIELSKEIYNKSTIGGSQKLIDKYVIGSDMVWNTEITGDDYTYFLDFVNEKRRKYAFSASSGDYSVLSNRKSLLALIDDFSYVAMREDDSARYLANILKRDIRHLQDPTVLIDNEMLEKLVSNPNKDNYVLVYYRDLNGKIFEDAKQYASGNGFDVLYVNIGKELNGVKNVFVSGIEEFLGYIKNAEAVFTSSYHGMLFSIYLNKKFWYYSNNQASRMDSVARSYGLENRNGSKNTVTETPIDYTDANRRIEKYRSEYMEELRRCFC